MESECERCDTTSSKPVTMATEEVNSHIIGTMKNPVIERDVHMAEAADASSAAGPRFRETSRVFFMATSRQWEGNKNKTKRRNKTFERVSAPGHKRSRMERIVRQQVCEVTQLHRPIDRMARILKAHVARDEVQWRSMKEWPEVSETKWDNRHKDKVL